MLRCTAKTSERQEENASVGIETSSRRTQDEKSMAEVENAYGTGGTKNELETSPNSTKREENIEQETDTSTGESSALNDQGEVGNEKHKPESEIVESLEPDNNPTINSTQSKYENNEIIGNTKTTVSEVSNSGVSEKSDGSPVDTNILAAEDVGKKEQGSNSDTLSQTMETNVEKPEPLAPVLSTVTDTQVATHSVVDQTSGLDLQTDNQRESLECPPLTTVSYPQLNSLIEQSGKGLR